MGWSDKTQIMTAEDVIAADVASSAVKLKSGETATVQVKANFPLTPTDSLDVVLQTTLDATSEDWDTQDWVDFTTVNIPNTTDPGFASFKVADCYKFRVVARRNGSTDTIVTDVWYRKDGDYADSTLDIK